MRLKCPSCEAVNQLKPVSIDESIKVACRVCGHHSTLELVSCIEQPLSELHTPDEGFEDRHLGHADTDAAQRNHQGQDTEQTTEPDVALDPVAFQPINHVETSGPSDGDASSTEAPAERDIVTLVRKRQGGYTPDQGRDETMQSTGSKSSTRPQLATAILFGLTTALFGYAAIYPQDVAERFPAMSSVYRAIGIDFETDPVRLGNVRITTEEAGTGQIALTGNLFNASAQSQPIPQLEVIFYSEDGAQSRIVEPGIERDDLDPKRSLASSELVYFSRQIEIPGEGVTNVDVRIAPYDLPIYRRSIE